MIDATDFLNRVSLFSLVSQKDLQRIAGKARYHLFNEGDVIIREGDPDNRLFIIVSGEVEIIKSLGGNRERLVRILGPTSYFGEMALIDDMARSASVVARKNTEILSLTQFALRREIERQPSIAFELLQLLSRRIRVIEKTMIGALGAVLPMCIHCKKIREEKGAWIGIEDYISDHSETEFTHSLCPICIEKLYPGLSKHK